MNNVLSGSPRVGGYSIPMTARNAVGSYDFSIVLNVVSVSTGATGSRVRRGRFLRSLEEDVLIRRERPQRQMGETEFTYPLPLGESLIKAIVRPLQERSDVGGIVINTFRYVCNITPIYEEVRLNDQLIRFVGTAKEQVLTVTYVDALEDILQLQLTDRNNIVE